MALDTFNPYLFVSSGEQSNKFLTPTYSGVIASFQAQRAQDLSGLTVRIDPIQAGTGDPSPSNIRPISGRTGMTVTRAGKNLLAQTDVARTITGVTFTPLADGGYHISGTATANIYYIIYGGFEVVAVPAPSYLVNGVQYVGSIDSNKCDLQIYLYGQGRYLQNAPFTVNRDVITACGIFLYVAAGTTIDEDVHPQIEVGSTATAYVPPTSTSYLITWQTEAGTIYGGTLDVVSGVLTVEWDYIASYNGETLPGKWISDRDVYAEGTTPTTGAEVAYKLAEPVTYQLDPEQIMTLPGFNQIYSDVGPIIDIKF